jgi:ABC-type Zn uptake system ZnuABC Zn-binding protein ZnuA
MTPHNALVYVHNIEAALSGLDPANAETYAANAEAYEAQLEALDQWVFAQIETIPPENRQMVTDHEAFGYYADRYGLDIIGAVIPSYSTAAEPSAQELAALEETIAEFSAPAIFIGSGVNSALAEQVAADTGTKLVPLYTESLGPSGSGVETYIDFIRYNTTAIVQGLTP